MGLHAELLRVLVRAPEHLNSLQSLPHNLNKSIWLHYIFIPLLLGSKAKTVPAKQKSCIQQKCMDYIEKWPFMVIFLYNLYICVGIQHLWGPIFNHLISEMAYNERSYEEVPVNLLISDKKCWCHIATDKALFFIHKCWYLSYFWMKTYLWVLIRSASSRHF